MSSPNAKDTYSAWDRLRIAFHRRLLHSKRIATLSERLVALVPDGAELLDLGCGDLTLAALIHQQRKLRRCVGADIWPLRSALPDGCSYVQIDAGQALPWDADAFDIVLLVDALHHCDDPAAVLREALRVGRRVIVKDHFEYGAATRLLLRTMDYVGNHAYGVSVPERYFTESGFLSLVESLDARLVCPVDRNLGLYGRFPLLGHTMNRINFIAQVERR